MKKLSSFIFLVSFLASPAFALEVEISNLTKTNNSDYFVDVKYNPDKAVMIKTSNACFENSIFIEDAFNIKQVGSYRIVSYQGIQDFELSDITRYFVKLDSGKQCSFNLSQIFPRIKPDSSYYKNPRFWDEEGSWVICSPFRGGALHLKVT